MALQIKMIPIGEKVTFGNLPRMFALLSNGIRDQSAAGVRFMTEYPPKPGQSTYRRTGTLRRSWFFRLVTGNRAIQGLIQSNANIAPYNEEVQGEDQEALFKRLGWRNVKDLTRLIQREFPKRMEAIVKRTFK